MDDLKTGTNSSTHLTTDMFEHELTEEMLHHITECDYCADLFADYTQDHMLLSAPPDMAEAILKRSRQLDVHMIAKSNELSKKMQLILYSLKVGAAALAAIMLILKVPVVPTFPEDNRHWGETRYFGITDDNIQKITDKLNQLSIKLFQTEDNLYD